jgi:hypothetical protein
MHHRGGTLSAVLLIAYFLQGAVALLLGLAATVWGLRIATDLGCAAIALLGITALWLGAFTRWSRRSMCGFPFNKVSFFIGFIRDQ